MPKKRTIQDKNQYWKDYNKKNLRRFSINLSKEKDQDIISHLDNFDNKQAVIKDLLRFAISKLKK
jgi:hypothetical protein